MRDAGTYVRWFNLDGARVQKKEDPAMLTVEGGENCGFDSALGFNSLAAVLNLAVHTLPSVQLRVPRVRRIDTDALGRIVIPRIANGALHYVQDARFDSMVHAKVVRPPSRFARFASVDMSTVGSCRA